jgi:Peptidase inhibitor I78 family
MKTMLVALLAGTALMACTPASEPAPATPSAEPSAAGPIEPQPLPQPPPADPAGADACGAAQYAALVGKPVTDPGVPPEGPNVRHIRPNTQVTMDYRADRLNVDIDAADVITGFRCT